MSKESGMLWLWRPYEWITLEFDQRPEEVLARLSDLVEPVRRVAWLWQPRYRTREFEGSITGNNFKISPIYNHQVACACQINGVIEDCPRGARLRMSVRHPFVFFMLAFPLVFLIHFLLILIHTGSMLTAAQHMQHILYLVFIGGKKSWECWLFVGMLFPWYVAMSYAFGVGVDKAKGILIERLRQ